jgi:hypothetical protein
LSIVTPPHEYGVRTVAGVGWHGRRRTRQVLRAWCRQDATFRERGYLLNASRTSTCRVELVADDGDLQRGEISRLIEAEVDRPDLVRALCPQKSAMTGSRHQRPPLRSGDFVPLAWLRVGITSGWRYGRSARVLDHAGSAPRYGRVTVVVSCEPTPDRLSGTTGVWQDCTAGCGLPVNSLFDGWE